MAGGSRKEKSIYGRPLKASNEVKLRKETDIYACVLPISSGAISRDNKGAKKRDGK